MRRLTVFVLAAGLVLGGAAQAQGVKIGFISSLSGPSAVFGNDLYDGFQLGIKNSGGTLGGLKVDVVKGDDLGRPDVGRQLAQKMIEQDKVNLVTGIAFSNVMLAVAKPVLDNKTVLLSINAGPSQLAGAGCHPYFFNVAFQGDNQPEAMGAYMTSKGIESVALLAPNYPGGKDFIAGFKRFYKGKVLEEIYTPLTQLDYSAELAQVRAKNPKGVFFFYPGGLGINFIKQFAQSGIGEKVGLYGPAASLDQTILPAVGDAALGAYASTQWSERMDNAENRKFVRDFEAAYGRIPSPYAAQAYDGARLLDAAIRSIGGKVADKEALRDAVRAAKFTSVRGNFAFNHNQFPVQDFFATRIEKDEKGRLVMAVKERIFTNHSDAYHSECAMK
jgi:branched-chain amino acid transport system substrate-binding protein